MELLRIQRCFRERSSSVRRLRAGVDFGLRRRHVPGNATAESSRALVNHSLRIADRGMRLLAFALLLFALASCGRDKVAEDTDSARSLSVPGSEASSGRQCVNLNTATAEELERLPGIGEVMARKVIEYRNQNGPFRRPEEIIIIEGFSERKYRAIAEAICVT